ncbi:glycosyl transferase family 28 [Thermobaculum terrenum ATCC BAA-798]|uniref:Glycosyl transferase family 28 n=1 Tax=Thermobaculum terrenum (strain ATCC BAA-798 / CCMEE 7001 / YNP1) TaxID=525904 RepID=D1CGT1_THET1|nr:glycosyltransferase [Thermobaculum terrenum]ACZ42952.1 glycosyl transferase family 28 [Thermobaculum terrenum ATCC BAA-798]
MAKVLITTSGSFGDLSQQLAVGKELARRGHQVALALPPSLAGRGEEEGFLVHTLPGDPAAEGSALRGITFPFGRAAPFASTRSVVAAESPWLAERARSLARLCLEYDLLVSSATQLAAASAAEMVRIPWATVFIAPAILPSELSPYTLPNACPPLLRRALSRVGWALGRWWMRRYVDPLVNEHRGALGLPTRSDWMLTGNLSPYLSILTALPSFTPMSPRWPPQVHQTGYCPYRGYRAWRPSPELRRFLEARGRLVLVTAGSMAHGEDKHSHRLYSICLGAVEILGAKALLVGPREGHVGKRSMAVPFVPFQEVMPRCAAVIHHGGVGTVQEAMLAGVPQLILPWGADHFFNAARAQEAGVAEVLLLRAYSQAALLRALGRVMDGPIAGRAGEVAGRARTEVGTSTTADLLEAFMRSQGRMHRQR